MVVCLCVHPWMYMYICRYACMYMYTYIHTHTHTHKHTHIHMYIYRPYLACVTQRTPLDILSAMTGKTDTYAGRIYKHMYMHIYTPCLAWSHNVHLWTYSVLWWRGRIRMRAVQARIFFGRLWYGLQALPPRRNYNARGMSVYPKQRSNVFLYYRMCSLIIHSVLSA